jgi:ribosomal protein S18 acetylase RimI-like enzyme
VTLPERILSYWKASLRLHQRVRETPWGAVVTDPRYPLVYEANHACVLTPAPELTVGDIRAELLPALEEAGARYEHIEFMDADDDSQALRDLVASPGEHHPDVVMVHEGGGRVRPKAVPDERSGEIEVHEVVQPDEPFWERYRLIPNQYGHALPDEVLGQMLARVKELFLPAGERFFVGSVGGAYAGVASVLTLEGVAYVDNVATLPEFRGRGVASATVGLAVRASLEAGARVVFLLAEEGGGPQRLYERLGFRVRRRCIGFTRSLRRGRGTVR